MKKKNVAKSKENVEVVKVNDFQSLNGNSLRKLKGGKNSGSTDRLCSGGCGSGGGM